MSLTPEINEQLQKLVDAISSDLNGKIDFGYQLEYGDRNIDMHQLLDMYRDLIPSGDGLSAEDVDGMASEVFERLCYSTVHGFRAEEWIAGSLYERISEDFTSEFFSLVEGTQEEFDERWKAWQNAREEFEEKTRDWFEGERLPEIVEEQLEKMADEQGVSMGDYHEFFRRHYARAAAEAMKEFEHETLPKELEHFDTEYLFG